VLSGAVFGSRNLFRVPERDQTSMIFRLGILINNPWLSNINCM
jgi:hypothetical protein